MASNTHIDRRPSKGLHSTMALHGSSIFVFSFGCLVACSGTTSGAPGPFAGTWSCTSTVTDTFSKPINFSTSSSAKTSSIVFVDNGNGTVTATGSSDAGAPCNLTFTTNGNAATVNAGQSCTISGITSVFTAGTYTVSGTTMTGSFTASFTGSLTGDAGATLNVSGTETVSSTCSLTSN